MLDVTCHLTARASIWLWRQWNPQRHPSLDVKNWLSIIIITGDWSSWNTIHSASSWINSRVKDVIDRYPTVSSIIYRHELQFSAHFLFIIQSTSSDRKCQLNDKEEAASNSRRHVDWTSTLGFEKSNQQFNIFRMTGYQSSTALTALDCCHARQSQTSGIIEKYTTVSISISAPLWVCEFVLNFQRAI